jgi:hypothetical protein
MDPANAVLYEFCGSLQRKMLNRVPSTSSPHLLPQLGILMELQDSLGHNLGIAG